MASCPNCYQEKPLFSSACPECTHKVTLGEQTSFSLLSTLFTFLILWAIVALIF